MTHMILNDGWTVTDGTRNAPLSVPGDVHSALLAERIIPDPYWRDTEVSLDWVHRSDWVAHRDFDLAEPVEGRHTLTLHGVDCAAVVSLNEVEVGRCENAFLRHDLDVTDALRPGRNRLEVRFLSNTDLAAAKAAAFPFPVPYLDWNSRLPHMNFLRKPQCHAGWDWNIALSPLGLTGDVVLRRTDTLRLDDVMLRQIHDGGTVTLEVSLHAEVTVPTDTTACLSIDGQEVTRDVSLYPGASRTDLTVTLAEPRLWWPAGHGAPEMYDLTVTLGDERRDLRVGLRQVDLITDKDDIGARFAFRVNGREIFMKGANWIPADALPERATPEAVRDLLQSAVDANMNMIRVWGGGQYEPDWFYETCSELGLMVWQDFMFACNLYPAADRDWLASVRTEATQQVRRLSSHPCLALWCGDNELVGALTWFPEAKADRDRYLAMYDRLNFALEEVVADHAPDVPFWPSSPSIGPLNFGDGWHDDTAGDMHFWDVWHSAKDFEHYRSVQPRFCSEFGFQSFPSARLIESFSEPSDRNVSSGVMDVHQRNQGGNSRIVETIARYFRFPDGFDEMTYLSQIAQALAMKTAIEFWRSSKPRCMGTLYWQLNDTWPVVSWASLEYGGGWKAVHHMARRFHADVLVTAQPNTATGEIVLWAVNDTPEDVSLSVGLSRVNVAGPMATLGDAAVVCPPDRAVEVVRLAPGTLAETEFLHFTWIDADRRHGGENDFLPRRTKDYPLREPKITVEDDADTVTLTTDVPALFVTWDHGGDDIWSDGCFTLLPGSPKVLYRTRARTSHLPDAEPRLRYLKGAR